MSPNRRFFGYMTIVIAVAGLVWLGLAVFRAAQGDSFDWVGLGIFAILIAAMALARSGR